MADIEIEIDGRKLAAKPNQTVIQVADEAGIYIPRFCYHRHLSIPANCRMCLVEVEKAPKALPACSTPVMPGMKVFTKSAKTLSAQRAVMAFLLINHPLDCPICDQGGECELQDLAMGYGSAHSKYREEKRAVADQDLGPLIATEMTRCIHCTRCVRFGDEIAGIRELGLIGRGEGTEISTYIQHAMQSEVSGNIIDLCPVGALTSKPYRFTARPWELDQAPGVSPHDCIGSNLNVHTRYGKVMRVVSRENFALNDVWLSDRDRFSYTGLDHPDRLEEPMARIDGQWQIVDWQKALEIAADYLKQTIAEHGADKLAGLASPNSTIEEFYLLQKLIRSLGSPHVDHRLREVDTSDENEFPSFPGLGMPIADLQTVESVLLVGSNISKEQPVAGVRLRQASLKGASISVINTYDHRFNFKINNKKIVAPQNLPQTLAAILKALDSSLGSNIEVDDATKNIAQQLKAKQNGVILLGAAAMHHPEAALIRALTQRIADLTQAKFALMTEGANGAGGWLAGAVPNRQAGGKEINHQGLNAAQLFEKPRKGYILVNVEPNLDCVNAHLAAQSLQQAQAVVALSLYRNPLLEAHAHVILPMAAFTETSGTFVNAAGDWQSFKGVAKPFSASRPAWKILRVLGNFLQLDGFDYQTSEEVRDEVKALVDDAPVKKTSFPMRAFEKKTQVSLSRIGEIPLYSTDSLVRRADPLQIAQQRMEGRVGVVRLHPQTAQHLKVADNELVRVSQGSAHAELPILLDDRVPENAAWIPGGILATSDLGDLFGNVSISSEKTSLTKKVSGENEKS